MKNIILSFILALIMLFGLVSTAFAHRIEWEYIDKSDELLSEFCLYEEPVILADSFDNLQKKYTLTEPMYIYINFRVLNSEQKSGGIVSTPYALNYEIGINGEYFDSHKPTTLKDGGEEEKKLIYISQDAIDAHNGVYELVINVRASKYPDCSLEQLGQTLHIEVTGYREKSRLVSDILYYPELIIGTSNTYRITVEDRANMIQFIEFDHGSGTGTRTFDRYSDNVSIVSYNNEGKIVSSTNKDLKYEVWTVTTPLADGQIGVRAKGNASSAWEDISSAFKFVNKYPTLNSGIISAALEKTEGKKGAVKVTIVTEKNAEIIQLKNPEGETFTSSNSIYNYSDNTRTFACSIYFHGTSGTINTATIRVCDEYGWNNSDVVLKYTIR